MESGIRSIFLSVIMALLLFTGTTAGAADGDDNDERDQVIQPEVARRDISHTGIDAENFETGAFIGLMNVEDFGTNMVYGARIGYHITEDVFTELTYGTTETGQTSFERLSGNIQLLPDNDRTLRYVNISFGFNVLPGESFVGGKWAFTSAIYLIGGVGSTRFGGNDNFTWNVGTGYQILMSDRVLLRLDVRDHVFALDLLGQRQTNNNLEVSGGVSWFF